MIIEGSIDYNGLYFGHPLSSGPAVARYVTKLHGLLTPKLIVGTHTVYHRAPSRFVPSQQFQVIHNSVPAVSSFSCQFY